MKGPQSAALSLYISCNLFVRIFSNIFIIITTILVNYKKIIILQNMER